MVDFFDKEKLGPRLSGQQHTTEEVVDRLNELDHAGGETQDKLMFLVKLPGDTGWRLLSPTLCQCDAENTDGSRCDERWVVITHNNEAVPDCPYHPYAREASS